MEIKVLESEKNLLKIDVAGEDHTFMNALRRELWNDNDVQAAGYTLEHSLTTSPILIVQTSKKNPKKVLDEAAQRLEKQMQELKEKFKKAF